MHKTLRDKTHHKPLKFSMQHLAFDESRQSLKTVLDSIDEDDKRTFRGSWQVMNCKQRDMYGIGVDGSQKIEVNDFEFPRPPIRLLSGTGACEYESLNNEHVVAQNSPYQAFEL